MGLYLLLWRIFREKLNDNPSNLRLRKGKNVILILNALESWDLKPSNFQKEQRQLCECY